MKYTEAFDIALVVLRERIGRYGEQYRADVCRTAAIAAANAFTDELAADAIDRVFQGVRISINPRWDGSIA